MISSWVNGWRSSARLETVWCALALRAYASAIRDGLPGGEHLAEEFLRDCGFAEAAAREILEQMIASAPLPDPKDLN